MKSPRLWNLQNKWHMNNAGFTVACNIHNMKNHSVDNLTDDMYCHKYMTVKCQTELRERAKPNSTEAAQTLVSVLRALLITSLNCRSCSSFSLSSSYTDRHHINVTSPSSHTASKYNQPLPSRNICDGCCTQTGNRGQGQMKTQGNCRQSTTSLLCLLHTKHCSPFIIYMQLGTTGCYRTR